MRTASRCQRHRLGAAPVGGFAREGGLTRTGPAPACGLPCPYGLGTRQQTLPPNVVWLAPVVLCQAQNVALEAELAL